MIPQVVNLYKKYLLSEEAIKAAVEDPNNFLTDKIFVGFVARMKANKLLNEDTISGRDRQSFFNASLCFHKTVFFYMPLTIFL